ncbi:MAG: hypothetical protein IT323_19235 [Anaerolineae bacterium]|nr:hypothetical protein [Anaerolineae bacterium]
MFRQTTQGTIRRIGVLIVAVLIFLALLPVQINLDGFAPLVVFPPLILGEPRTFSVLGWQSTSVLNWNYVLALAASLLFIAVALEVIRLLEARRDGAH